jgi:probable F420-dependent oxidoreductase
LRFDEMGIATFGKELKEVSTKGARAVKFGVHLRPTAYTIDIRDLALAVEELGFESLWVSEHSHIPTSLQSHWPGGDGLPRFMTHFFDPFVTLSAAAAVTSRIRLGTGICLVPQRDTIQLAKQVATLDLVSGGRFIFGIGAGWNREEMRNHGIEPSRRWRRMREQVLAMRTIWTQDEAEFHGIEIDFDSIWQWPKPVQKPSPPVLVGGEGETVLQRVLEYGDGWLPNDHPTLAQRIQELHALAAEAGREAPPVTVFATEPEPDTLEHHIRAGVERCVFNLPTAAADRVISELKRLAALTRDVA